MPYNMSHTMLNAKISYSRYSTIKILIKYYIAIAIVTRVLERIISLSLFLASPVCLKIQHRFCFQIRAYLGNKKLRDVEGQ